ncbi:MAG: very short patch repair endonuclease [Chloroflexi bacterium]|nr:very short patch repair endonuclease [Chloroflexota bacterium]
MTDNLTPEQRSYCMSRIRSKDMTPELAVRSMTHRMGFRFRLHRKDLPGKPDLTLARHRAVIFVHGCFWHWHQDPDCPIAGLPKSNLEYWTPKLTRTRERDNEHLSALHELGWRTLVVWECELRNSDAVFDRLQHFLLAEAVADPARLSYPRVVATAGTGLDA